MATMPDCPWWLTKMPLEKLEADLWVQPDQDRRLYVPAEGDAPPTLDMYRAMMSPSVSSYDRSRAIARRLREDFGW